MRTKMVWRFLGFVTGFYAFLGFMGLLVLIFTGRLFQQIVPIDFSAVPTGVAIPIWIAYTPLWFVTMLLFGVLGVFAFLRRAHQFVDRKILMIYGSATTFLGTADVASRAFLATHGYIGVGKSWMIAIPPRAMIGTSFVVLLICAPAVVALVAGGPRQRKERVLIPIDPTRARLENASHPGPSA
jgi:hypothetical protein